MQLPNGSLSSSSNEERWKSKVQGGACRGTLIMLQLEASEVCPAVASGIRLRATNTRLSNWRKRIRIRSTSRGTDFASQILVRQRCFRTFTFSVRLTFFRSLFTSISCFGFPKFGVQCLLTNSVRMKGVGELLQFRYLISFNGDRRRLTRQRFPQSGESVCSTDWLVAWISPDSDYPQYHLQSVFCYRNLHSNLYSKFEF